MEKKEEVEVKPDPLDQLITCLSRAATKEQHGSLPEDDLYMSYAQIMAQVPGFCCNTHNYCKIKNCKRESCDKILQAIAHLTNNI